MRVAVTRPQPDADRQAEKLIALGHEVIVEPMMSVEFLDVGPLDLSGVQALAVTSRNALRALARRGNSDRAKDMPLYAVGEATAALAESLGFADVHKGGGTSAALASLVSAECDPADGLIVHLAGERLAADLKGDLEAAGYRVRQETLYRTVPVKGFGASTGEALANGAIDGVMLMSPATAQIWARLLVSAGGAVQATDICYFCLSRAVADALGDVPEKNILVADAPREDRLLALVGPETAH